MKPLLKLLPWKRTMNLSIGVLAVLIIFSFYGLYTNTFYLLKPDNYIIPLLSSIHFIFLYVLWFKIKEDELTDPQMRNLEYALYGVFIVYIYKTFETIYILTTYADFSNHLMPGTFFPIGIAILILYIALLLLTMLAFIYRRDLVGEYKFDDLNQHIDSWE